VSLIRSLVGFKVLANVHGAAAAGARRSCCILWPSSGRNRTRMTSPEAGARLSRRAVDVRRC